MTTKKESADAAAEAAAEAKADANAEAHSHAPKHGGTLAAAAVLANFTHMGFTKERFDEFHEFEAQQAKTQGVASFRPLRRLLNFAINVAIRRAKDEIPGFSEEAARAAIEQAISEIGDGKIWEWLVNGGFEQLVEWMLMLFRLFGK